MTIEAETSLSDQVREVLELVDTLDFTMLKSKLTNPNYDTGWSEEEANIAERDYKRYLAVCKVLGRQLVPSKEIDTFWHDHILDTRRYATDCQLVFGEFFHHYPFFGLRGDDDRARWEQAWRETNLIWQEIFGMPMKGVEPGTCLQAGRN